MVENIPTNVFRPYNFHVICGCVGDEKYLEAVRTISKTKYAGSQYQIFVHEDEPRSEEDLFKIRKETFDGYTPIGVKIQKVKHSSQIPYELNPTTTTVGILDAHYFDMELPELVLRLRKEGRFVVIAGVDKTFEGDPIGPMGYLLVNADSIVKKYDKCKYCNNVGTRVEKLVNGAPAEWGNPITDHTNAKYGNVCLNHYKCHGSPAYKFLENYKNKVEKVGKLTVCYGTMSSGKSESMITNVLGEARKQNKEYLFLKSSIDTRTPGKVVSRTESDTGKFGIDFPAQDIGKDNMWEFTEKAKDWKKKIIGIDEMQFIPNASVFVNALRLSGHDVVIAGIVKDFKRELFGCGDYLLAEAEETEFSEAICDVIGCSNKAVDLIRLINGEPAAYDSPIIIVEAQEGVKTEVEYKARCLFHHQLPGKPDHVTRKQRRILQL